MEEPVIADRGATMGKWRRWRVWAIGLGALAALVVSIAGAIGSQDDPLGNQPTAAAVSAVKVSVLDQAQPPVDGETATSRIVEEAGVDPTTLRKSQDLGGGNAIWVGKADDKKICLLTIAGANGAATCNTPAVIASFGSIPLTTNDASNRFLVMGLVADGVQTATMGETTVAVTRNTFVFTVDTLSDVSSVNVSGPATSERSLRYDALLPPEAR